MVRGSAPETFATPGGAGKDWTETACPVAPPGAEAAPPEDPLRLNRGRRAVRNMNRRRRDRRCGGDACLTRTGSGPANRASLNSMAPAVVFAGRRGAESPAQTRRRLRPACSQAAAALARP